MIHRVIPPESAREEGIGLLEIVVAMFLLALLSVALLPLLLNGFAASKTNATLVAASQLVNQQIEDARARTACSTITATSATSSGPQGVPLQTTRTVAPCPSSYPGTMTVTVTVVRTDTNATVSTATTLVFVSTAS